MRAMTTLIVVASVFLFLEAANVLALYFAPDSDKFNSVGVFKAWEQSKADSDVHDLVRYLTFWVAGTKLIFILVLLAVLIYGDDRIRVIAVAGLGIAVLSYYWRLAPLARKIDNRGLLNPDGYSTVLTVMITVFVIALGVGVAYGAASL